MIHSVLTSFFLLIIGFSALGQIQVDDAADIVTIVKKLEGPGVKISNVTYRYFLGGFNSSRPIGYFSDDFGVLGVDKGLLITSGAAKNALGPNDQPGKTQINWDDYQDPDLVPYIEDYDSISNRMNDLCVVEFDIISSRPYLSFKYVFGSEEYIEFLDYHDIFVFLISGPGITGTKNLALIPGTNTPVSVASINPFVNSQYYISNGSGLTPFINIDLQYDGYTSVLTAETEIVPCQTYHIKLAIADVLDDTYDAGVFIEEGSFKSSDISLYTIYEYPRFNTALEECNDAFIVFKRPGFSDDSSTLKYYLDIKGNAVNGIDYIQIADSLIIPPGTDTAFIRISSFDDGISDDNELVRIVIKSACPTFPDLDSIDVLIRENFSFPIPDEKICTGQSVVLNKNYLPGDSVFWDPNPDLSCQICPSPNASPGSTRNFLYTVRDTASGCEARDSVNVEVIKVVADFEYTNGPCYTTLDFFFKNKSEYGSTYLWEFGDQQSSEEESPLHQYSFTNKKGVIQFDVKLTAYRTNPSCSADTIKTIIINDPLFISNLISANGDLKNDNWEIQGVTPGCWKVKIYNRWGELVYYAEDISANFSGQGLESGVYYYVLMNFSGDREFKGWIHLLTDKK